jgi:hypothetical protein
MVHRKMIGRGLPAPRGVPRVAWWTAAMMVVPSLLLLVDPATAWPKGAGGCEGGVAAVGGLHLDKSDGRAVAPGDLFQGVIRVTIQGQELDPATPKDVPTNEDLLITVEAGDLPYLGLLIRLEAPNGVDTKGALVKGANTQNSGQCKPPIVGITHFNREEKKMATGTIRFDEEVDGVQLDVTVVFINSDQGSAYVYSRLPVNFRNAANNTTSAPTATGFNNSTETKAPTSSPATENATGTTAAPTSKETSGTTAAPAPMETSGSGSPLTNPSTIPSTIPSTSPQAGATVAPTNAKNTTSVPAPATPTASTTAPPLTTAPTLMLSLPSLSPLAMVADMDDNVADDDGDDDVSDDEGGDDDGGDNDGDDVVKPSPPPTSGTEDDDVNRPPPMSDGGDDGVKPSPPSNDSGDDDDDATFDTPTNAVYHRPPYNPYTIGGFFNRQPSTARPTGREEPSYSARGERTMLKGMKKGMMMKKGKGMKGMKGGGSSNFIGGNRRQRNNSGIFHVGY